MGFRLRILRATTEANTQYVGEPGQMVLDTQTYTLYLHDGETPGGQLVGLNSTQVKDLINQALNEYPFSDDEKIKLQGIEDGATVNSPDRFLLDRANHEGIQSADSIDGLASGAFSEVANFPFVNLMPDSGRFGGRINPLQYQVYNYVPSEFLNPYNGSSVVNVGQFIYNNSTYGGTKDALTASVDNLLKAQGRGNNARYGVEFFVVKFTQGSGTQSRKAVNGVDCYLLTTNTNRVLIGAGNLATFTCWINVTNGTVVPLSDYHLNGELQESGTPIPKGWHRLRIHHENQLGYDNAFPYLYASTGATLEMALPAFFNGYVDPGNYTSPITTINELIN